MEGKKDISYSRVSPDEVIEVLPPATEPSGCSFGGIICSVILNILLLPLMLLPIWGSFFTVQPQEEALILFWGRLNAVKKEAGVHFYPWIGRSIVKISTKVQTIDIKKTTVVDANGNPIIVSGIVTYKIVHTIRAAFDVGNVQDYLERQALACLKKVCSKYPYESKDGHSLQQEQDHVSKQMINVLQRKADLCGAKILSYELADLQYAPEIAQGMLVRQQAQALLDARKTVVDGAVGIVTTAMFKLHECGVKLSDKEQTRLVSNLLAVICSDARVQPMFSISETVDHGGSDAIQEEMLKTLNAIKMNTLRAPQ